MKGWLIIVMSLSGPIFAKPNLSEDRMVLHTTHGDLAIAFYPSVAPQHYEQFKILARGGVYHETPVIKIDPQLMIQFGGVGRRTTPLSPVQEKLLRKLPAEFSEERFRYGTVAMARNPDDPNSAESSFLIILSENPKLDGVFTVVGEVTNGLNTIDKIQSVPVDLFDKPIVEIRILSADILPASAVIHLPNLEKLESIPTRVWTNYAFGFALLAFFLMIIRFFSKLSQLDAVGRLSVLVAYFCLLAGRAPIAKGGSIEGLILFTAGITVFYMLGRFERAS